MCVFIYVYMGMEFVGEDVSDIDPQDYDSTPIFIVCMYLLQGGEES